MTENIYHRYLDLPFEITKHPDFTGSPTDMKHYDINDYNDDAMNEWHKSLGLYIRHTEIFYTPPGGNLPIHCDEAELTNHVKINKTWGPEEGVTRWWTSNNVTVNDGRDGAKEVLENFDDNAIEEFSYREHRVLVSNPDDCNLVYEANTNTPSIVNVGQLHDTHNPTDQGRWTICFVPARGDDFYIYWDEAMEIYKDFIKGDNNGN